MVAALPVAGVLLPCPVQIKGLPDLVGHIAALLNPSQSRTFQEQREATLAVFRDSAQAVAEQVVGALLSTQHNREGLMEFLLGDGQFPQQLRHRVETELLR